MPLSKDTLRATITRIRREEPSVVMGGALLLQELTRAEYRAIATRADMGEERVNIDQWNGGIFAAGVIDPSTDAPMFSVDELMAWPQRAALWNEIQRVVTCILDLSEVGTLPLAAPSAD